MSSSPAPVSSFSLNSGIPHFYLTSEAPHGVGRDSKPCFPGQPTQGLVSPPEGTTV